MDLTSVVQPDIVIINILYISIHSHHPVTVQRCCRATSRHPYDSIYGMNMVTVSNEVIANSIGRANIWLLVASEQATVSTWKAAVYRCGTFQRHRTLAPFKFKYPETG